MFRARALALWEVAEEKLACWAWRKEGFMVVLQALHNGARWDDNPHTFKQEHFSLNIRKGEKWFTSRTIKQWNRLPREAMCSPYLFIFITRLNKFLSNLVWSHSWLSRRLDKRPPEVPFKPNYPIILWWQVHMPRLIVFSKKEKRCISHLGCSTYNKLNCM